MGQYELFPRAAWQDLPLSVLYYIHTNETMPGDHSHTFYELVLVREGGAFHFMNDETVPIRAGNVFLVPPGKIHGYRDTEHLGIYNILFSAKILDTFKHDLSNTPNYQMLFHLQPELFSNMRTKTEMLTLDHGHFTRVVTLADEIMGEEKRKESGGRTVAFGEFLHLIGYIIRHAHIAGSSEKTRFIRSAACWRSWTGTARESGRWRAWPAFVRMSQSSFRQQFRLMTGTAPITYLLRLRLQKAASLLRLSGRIGDVAMRVGFQDTNYFTRQFHAFYGCSPREYKRQYKN